MMDLGGFGPVLRYYASLGQRLKEAANGVERVTDPALPRGVAKTGGVWA